jgi:hypothetical protein
MLRTDPERDIETTLRAVLVGVGDRRLIRIGRRRIELEAIYRRAVERAEGASPPATDVDGTADGATPAGAGAGGTERETAA